MIQFKIKPFLYAQDILVNASTVLHYGKGSKFPNGVNASTREEITEQIEPLVARLAGDEFLLCRRAAERLLETLQTERDPIKIASVVNDLRRRLLDQSESMESIWLSPSERELFAPQTPLFGDEFAAKFASAGVFELDEAAKCLALGRATAAVFHLMRVMEVGIRATAHCLGAPDPTRAGDRNWGPILRNIKVELDARGGQKPTKTWKAGDREFFEGAYANR